jgi:hypothetical protein
VAALELAAAALELTTSASSSYRERFDMMKIETIFSCR